MSFSLSRLDATALATSVTTFSRPSEYFKLDEDWFVKLVKGSDARSWFIGYGRKWIFSVIAGQMFHIKFGKDWNRGLCKHYSGTELVKVSESW